MLRRQKRSALLRTPDSLDHKLRTEVRRDKHYLQKVKWTACLARIFHEPGDWDCKGVNSYWDSLQHVLASQRHFQLGKQRGRANNYRRPVRKHEKTIKCLNNSLRCLTWAYISLPWVFQGLAFRITLTSSKFHKHTVHFRKYLGRLIIVPMFEKCRRG